MSTRFASLRFSNVALLSLALLLASGCATMGRSRNEEEIAKVKKAAVVAYVMKAPASNRMSLSLNSGKMQGAIGGSSFYQKSEQANLIFADFQPAFASASRWNLVPTGYVKENGTYTSKAQPMMAIVQIRDLPPAGENWYLVDKLMAPQALELLDRNSKNQLMAGLGVDALVAVEVKTEFAGGFKFLGLGGHHPQSTMRFKVYTRDNDEPAWTEWIQGDKTEESTGLTGFMSEEDMLKLARKSARQAFAKIGSEIK